MRLLYFITERITCQYVNEVMSARVFLTYAKYLEPIDEVEILVDAPRMRNIDYDSNSTSRYAV